MAGSGRDTRKSILLPPRKPRGGFRARPVRLIGLKAKVKLRDLASGVAGSEKGKPWYLSKAVWLGAFQLGVGAYNRDLRQMFEGLALIFLRQSIGLGRKKK